MKKINRNFLFLCTVFIIIFCCLFVNYKNESSKYGKIISQTTLNFKSENIILVHTKKDDENIWLLEKRGFWKTQMIELSGFENDVEKCGSITDLNENLVCLKGLVGVHSTNYVFINLDTFSLVEIVGYYAQAASIYSDVPLALVDRDYLMIDRRNYNDDPINDAIRYYFTYNGKEFVFDKKENITYDGSENNFRGEL